MTFTLRNFYNSFFLIRLDMFVKYSWYYYLKNNKHSITNIFNQNEILHGIIWFLAIEYTEYIYS